MANRAFCTIITDDYLHYAKALRDSLVTFDSSISLNVLICTAKTNWKITTDIKNIQLHFLEDVCEKGLGKAIYNKYYKVNKDHFRWSMKPVFINYLLLQKGIDKVLCVDSDILFFGDYQFLFDALNTHKILLTPHWRSHQPSVDKDNFGLLFIGGLYNAGFVGVAKGGESAMDWWATVCLYECTVDKTRGLFVDQAYLNLLPIYFDNVEILKHRGCNVAGWNFTAHQQVLVDQQVLINRKDPIIFIHFSNDTINKILKGKANLLLVHLRKYEKILQKYKSDFQFKVKYGKMSDRSPFFKRIKNFLLFHLDRL